MSFQFCFSKLLDKPQMLLKLQIILPLFHNYFSSAISTVFNMLMGNIYQYLYHVDSC